MIRELQVTVPSTDPPPQLMKEVHSGWSRQSQVSSKCDLTIRMCTSHDDISTLSKVQLGQWGNSCAPVDLTVTLAVA